MKIAIDLTALSDNFSGIERFTAMIAYNLISSCSKDSFILFFKREIFPDFVIFKDYKNVKIVILKEHSKLLFSQIIFPINLYKYKADKWLFMAFPTPLLYFRKGSISVIHDIGCWDLPDAMTTQSIILFRTLYRIASIRDEKIITVSNFSKNRIQSKLNISEKKIKVVYNGLSENSFKYYTDKSKINKIKKKYGLPNDYILCLSTLEPRKNLPLLIKACCDLWKEDKLDAYLVLAGRKGWKYDSILGSIEQELKNKIIFTGFIDDEDLPTVYHQAKVFIFPSLYEGFGIPPLEALAVDTDVISSNSSSLPEILGNAVTYFKNGDLNDLKKHIVNFCNGERAYGSLPRKYDWKTSAIELRRFLESK